MNTRAIEVIMRQIEAMDDLERLNFLIANRDVLTVIGHEGGDWIIHREDTSWWMGRMVRVFPLSMLKNALDA